MGFSIAGAGHVAAGMADMEGQLAQNKFRHQLNEQMASQVRQQQEREAFERMARRNIQAPQWNLGNLPQGQMQNQPAAAPAAPEQVSARNENYGNEGRGKPPVVTGELEKLQAERAQYEQLLKGTQSNIAALNEAKNIPPSAYFAEQERKRLGRVDTMKRGVNAFAGGPVFNVPPPGQDPRAELTGQEAGYKQGIAQYDQLIAEQAKKQPKRVMEGSSPSGKRASASEAALRPVIAGTPEEQAMDAATEAKLQGSNIAELQKEIARTKDPKARAVLEQELQAVTSGRPVQPSYAQATQQAAVPQAPQNLTGQATVMSGPNYDLGMQQLKQQYDYLATVMQNTFDSQQRLQVLGQMQQLQQKGQEMQIERVGQAAQFNPEALQQLVSFMAGRVGQPIGVVTDGKGRAQLVRQDGQPIQGQWGQQMPVATLVDGILNNLIPSRAAANSADAAVRSKAMAESTGKAVGDMQVETVKGQYGLAREQMQGLSMAVITQAKEAAHNGRWGQAVPDGMGGFIAARPDGTFVHSLAPVTDKSGKVSTPQPRVITFDQLNAGMIPRG